MIYFGFDITNPWRRRWANVWNRVYPTPHPSKYIELEMFKDSTIVSFNFRFATRQDHAGVSIDIGLLGYSFKFQFYDIRHWNSVEGRWMIYTEEKGSH